MATNRSAIAVPKLSLSAAYTLTKFDDGVQYSCTTALTITAPEGLGAAAPTTIAIPPATGNLTITPGGAATINGAALAITRTFANNRLGVIIEPNPYTANDWSVSGS